MNNKLHDLTFGAERFNYFCRKSLKIALPLLVMLLSLAPVAAQNVIPKITLNISNVSIEAFFTSVEKQSGYKFLYRKDIIDNTRKVTINCTAKPLTDLLNEQLPKLNLNYKFTDKTIVLSQRQAPKVTDKVMVKGKVIDGETKKPIAGATVIIKGTSVGAITDAQGVFSFQAKLTDEVEISFVGMVSVNRVIKSEQLVVEMKEDIMSVEDVVVTGYQTIDRKLFTGSASKLNAEKTLLKGSGDITTSLQGKVSGVQISAVSSTFGASPVLTIRGNSSINGSNKPLWVVDGVVLEDLMTVSADELTSGNLSTLLSSGVAGLNPEDISSFEILKDVSATSLYGAQAMNGVIVITTKKGKKDKLSVNYSGSVAIKTRPSYSNFDILNSVDEMSIYKELERKGWIDVTTVAKSENFGAMGKMFDQISKGKINWGANGGLNEEFLGYYANSNTDWFGELFKNAVVNQHSLSLSGGGAKSTFYASLSYYGDGGMARSADKVDRYTASLRGDFDLSKTVKLGVKLSANVRDQRVPGTKNRDFDAISGAFVRDFDINPFNYVLNTSRSMRAYDNDGNLEYFRRSYTDFNIIHELSNNFVDITVNDIASQVDLEYKPIKSLTLRGALQYRAARTLSEHKIHEKSNQAEAYRATYSQAIIDSNRYLFSNPDMPTSNPYSILPEGGFYNTDESELRHTYFRTTADYSPKLGGLHSVNLFAGFEMNMVNRKNRSNDGWGYIWDRGGVMVTHPDVMKYLKAQGQDYFNYYESHDRRISSFINGAYSFAGRYVFNAGFRYDGSNQLGRSRAARYLPSWNVSGAWNIHEEAFMQGTEKSISLLKPKISYGYNGIMGPSTSAELTIYSDQTLRPTDNEVVNEIGSLQNNDLTWEKMAELNIGFELGLISNKITMDFAYYNRKSTDLIDRVTTSGIGGVVTKLGNIGNMKSSGFEFSINTTNIQTNNFAWRTNFNMNFHKSEITKLNNFAQASGAISNLGVAMLGYPQRGLFSTRFASLDNQGIPTFYGVDNKIVYDMNLQNRIDIDTYLKYEGPLEPRGYGGLNNSFSYKNWGLNFGLVYKYGNVIRLDDKYQSSYNDHSSFTQDLKNRWIMPGDEKRTTVPAILDQRTSKQLQGKNAYQLYNKSTEMVAKGDFIRLKDVTVQYSMPRQMLSKTFLTGVNLSFQATNLWLLYSDKKLNGLDPEFFLSGGVSSPISTTYTFTLNLSF